MKKLFLVVAMVLVVALLFGCTMDNDNNKPNNDQTQNDPEPGDEGVKPDEDKPDVEKPDEENVPEKDDSTEAKPDAELSRIKDYFPIRENTRYIYEGEGNEYAAYDVYIDYISANKIQQRVDNGGTVSARSIELKDGKLIRIFLGEEIYYREDLLEIEDVEAEVLLMEPLKEGTSWTYEDSKTRSITGTSVNIETPSGNYETIEVLTQGPENKAYDYYAKDIGLVKSVFVMGDVEVYSVLAKIEKDVSLTQTIKFYYPNIDNNKVNFQTKEIEFYTNDISRQVLEKAYKEEPKDGFQRVFSENTKINSLYLNKDGMVYIDLNQAFIDDMNAGAGYESMILQSIANTFGKYYNAERVILTIDNELYESGHIKMKKWEFIKVDNEGT